LGNPVHEENELGRLRTLLILRSEVTTAVAMKITVLLEEAPRIPANLY
jgi:hypothetical protein